MRTSAFKPVRVGVAVLGGLVLGVVLVRTFTPRTAAQGEDEPIDATLAPARVRSAAADAGAPLARLSHELLAQKVPPYPGAGKWVRIGDALDTNRVPMVMASFETPDADGKVLEHYAKYFERAGFPWQGVEESLRTTGLPALSATDVMEGLQLSVIAFPHAGGTTVIVSAADMDTFYERAESEVPDDGDLPGYPGAQPMVMRTSDGPRDAVMVTFATHDSPADVQSFYRETLAKQGFKEVAVEGAAPASRLEQLEFVADGRMWRLFMSRTGSGTSVTAQGGRP